MDNFNQERFRWESATTFAAAKKMSNSLRAVTPTPTSCSASITSSKTSPSTISSTSGADTPVPTIRARTAKPSTTSLHMNAFPTALSGLPPKDIPQVIAKQTARTESKIQKKKSESEGLVAGATSLVTLGAGGMARMGAIVEAFELGERILMWKDASLSSIVLITFLVCCAYPIIILILPQLILSLYILYRYISKAPPLAPPPPVQSDLMTVMDILGSEKYNRYLSFVQNQMTLFCESMDSLATFHETYFTWRNPSKTSMFLKGVVVAIPVTLLGAFIVPFWLVRLVIGVCGAWVLCRETWICMMLVDVMPKYFGDEE
ncbi:hypothetical protein BCR33DRAFT_499006 [Rhizoclosmatium globosum]|uniref:Peroxin domain-containing protein n=1 Tax=Rhizoclosmatium globosum TaxID=329046 RepID=A0A1Y2CXA0_9FUNG|nr:hypothetical protein BCR33DRAFT_499006 [Rhizoclosmatium globosum]|eukprot:ORY50955.1 hypothetical protein BCR33DRAFT_499006 [Rhizoclosmatium globosum]